MKRQTMYAKMVASSLARRKSRMVVALLAVVIGATVLCGLFTIYFDMPRQMGREFRGYGANMILVPGPDSAGITPQQIADATAVIDDGQLVGVAPYRYQPMTINATPVVVAGADLAQVRATSPYWYVTGAWPDASGQVLVGAEQAQTYDLAPGDTVELVYAPAAAQTAQDGGGNAQNQVARTFTVSGTLDTGGNEESYFFISNEDMQSFVGQDMPYDVVELSVQATAGQLEDYAGQIEQAQPAVVPQLVKRIAQSETTVLGKLQALILIVTIIVLALTMICVATTMTAVVAERRKEIALRKALGAHDRSIMLEFMGEELVIGALGGLVGSALGFGFAQIVSSSVFNSVITFRPALVPLAIVVALVVTAAASAVPVRSATKIDPAVVLKGE